MQQQLPDKYQGWLQPELDPLLHHLVRQEDLEVVVKALEELSDKIQLHLCLKNLIQVNLVKPGCMDVEQNYQLTEYQLFELYIHCLIYRHNYKNQQKS